jgi:hypothetical protein
VGSSRGAKLLARNASVGIDQTQLVYFGTRGLATMPASRRDPERFLSRGTRRIRISEGSLSLRPQRADWNIGINA